MLVCKMPILNGVGDFFLFYGRCPVFCMIVKCIILCQYQISVKYQNKKISTDYFVDLPVYRKS